MLSCFPQRPTIVKAVKTRQEKNRLIQTVVLEKAPVYSTDSKHDKQANTGAYKTRYIAGRQNHKILRN